MIKFKKNIRKEKKKVYGRICIQNKGDNWKWSSNWIWLFESWYNEKRLNDKLYVISI